MICPHCYGKGHFTEVRLVGNVRCTIHTPCPECEGWGLGGQWSCCDGQVAEEESDEDGST